MAVSPLLASEGALRVRIQCEGVRQEGLALVSVSLRHALNELPRARLVMLDGDMPNAATPLCDGKHFEPGAAITVCAGYGESEDRLFTGVVVEQGFSITANNERRLTLDCRATAVKMTQERRTAHYLNQSDADLFDALIGRADIQAKVSDATGHHEAVVQFDCSDWDFLLARAAALGLVVNVVGEVVTVQPPDLKGEPALCVTWGQDLIDFKAERSLKDSTQLQGELRFQGSALAKPGGLMELAGLGTRFSGKVLLRAVEHELMDGNWFTRAEFGLEPGQPAMPSGELALGGVGLQIGVVLKVGGDPAGASRIQVRLPGAQPGKDTLWARWLQATASKGFGHFLPPEIGDEVLIGHLHQDPAQPVVLGALYGSAHRPPYALDADNTVKAIVMRGGHRIEFNDEAGSIRITTGKSNQLVFSDQEESVLIKDQHGNRIAMSKAGIALESSKDLSFRANGSIHLDAASAMHLEALGDVKLDGLNVACQAQVSFSAKGEASAELTAAGQTTVKGALIRIN